MIYRTSIKLYSLSVLFLSPLGYYTIPNHITLHTTPRHTTIRTEQLADDGAGLQAEGGQSTLLAVVVVVVVYSAVDAVG